MHYENILLQYVTIIVKKKSHSVTVPIVRPHLTWSWMQQVCQDCAFFCFLTDVLLEILHRKLVMLLLLISCSHLLTRTRKWMALSSTTLTLFVLMLQSWNYQKEGKYLTVKPFYQYFLWCYWKVLCDSWNFYCSTKLVNICGNGLNKVALSQTLTLYTLTSECIFSILFSIHFLKCQEGEFFNHQELLSVVIISFILVTPMFDSGVMQ